MILGSYPCCGEGLGLGVPEVTPAYMREECPHCGVPVWHKLSRWDPESWTEEDFLKTYIVDEENHKISLRNPPVPLSPELQAIQDAVIDILADSIVKDYEELLMTGSISPKETPDAS